MKLYPFQKEDSAFLASRKRALIASEPGLGKTCTLIKAVPSNAKNILVLCPKSIVGNWKREIKDWDKDSTRYTVLNHDKLISKKFMTELMKVKWDVIILDESHTFIKTENTIRCKSVVKLVEANKDAYLWLSTATPATNSAADYYVTLKLLLGSIEKLGKLNNFRENFCEKIPIPWNPKGFVYRGFRKDTAHILREAFKRLAIKRLKKDVMPDLPDMFHTKLWVDVCSDLVGQSLDLDPEMVRILIDNGSPLPAHVSSTCNAISQAKLADAVEINNNFPAHLPFVNFVWFKETGRQLAEAIECKALINGDTPQKDRDLFVKQFRDGELNRIICNIQAGGVGINLQRASDGLFIDLPWSAAHFTQAQGRLHRIGSKYNVNYSYLLAKGTIDETIYSALMSKLEGIKRVGV